MPVAQILNWFRQAVPAPAKKNFNTQCGCDFEETAEMLEALEGDDPYSNQRLLDMQEEMQRFAEDVKAGAIQLSIKDPVKLLDAICDRVVTGVGVGHMCGMDVLPAVQEVADSNDSKFVDGQPVFDANRKIMKGPNYFKPNLEPYADGARVPA